MILFLFFRLNFISIVNMFLRALIIAALFLSFNADAMAAREGRKRKATQTKKCKILQRAKYSRVIMVISGPSGVGKSVAMRKAVELAGESLVRVPSVTTRVIRSGEKEGVDYFFVNANEFGGMLQRGDLLEHAQVFNNSYGLSREKMSKVLGSERDVIVDTDWQGAEALRKLPVPLADVVTVYLLPPSMTELQRRLTGRGTDAADVVAYRMKGAVEQLEHWQAYDYVLRADDVNGLAKQIVSIYKASVLQMSTCRIMPAHAANMIRDGKEMLHNSTNIGMVAGGA